MRYVVINGQRIAWCEVLKLRREQRKAERQPQPTLFEMKDDKRPPLTNRRRWSILLATVV